MSEVAVYLVVVAGILGIGLVIGILIAPILIRWQDRQETPADNPYDPDDPR
jgi:hypothetical protein